MNKDRNKNSEDIPLEELSIQERIIRAYNIDDGSHRRDLFKPGFRTDIAPIATVSEIRSVMREVDQAATELLPEDDEHEFVPLKIKKHRQRKTSKHNKSRWR